MTESDLDARTASEADKDNDDDEEAHDDGAPLAANTETKPEVAPDPPPEIPDDAAVPASSQRGIRAALVGLPAPEPKSSFWSDIERGLDEQDQLDIVARPAIRSINDPPPLAQPRLDDDPARALAARYQQSPTPRGPATAGHPLLDEADARRRRLFALGAVVLALVVLIAASVIGGEDESGGPKTAAPSTTTAPPSNAPQSVPGLDPAAPLTPTGVGPLQAGLVLSDLQATGAALSIDLATFEASGGTCFDVSLPAAPDLILRFRSPDPEVGIDDPAEGVLVSVNIQAGIGSAHASETGVALGASEEQLLAAHAHSLRASDHPSIPGGHVYVISADAANNTGIAYVTDGHQVTEISAGLVEVIRLRQACA